MKVLVALLAVALAPKAFGKCDVDVPKFEIKVMAGNNQVLVPVIASYERLERTKFTLSSIDDGFTIPVTNTQKINVVVNAEKNLLEVPAQVVDLDRSGPGCQRIRSIRIAINAKPNEYDKEYLSVGNLPNLINYGTLSKYIDFPNMEEFKNFLKKTEHVATLPELTKFTGVIIHEGEYKSIRSTGHSMVVKTEKGNDMNVPISTGYSVDTAGEKCLEGLAGSNRPATVYVTAKTTGSGRSYFEIVNIDPETLAACK